MRRLRAGDVGLLAIFLPLWLACAALHLKEVASGRLAWVSVYAAAAPARDGFPSVRGFWPGAGSLASGGLLPGDRLLSVGGSDLRGVGPFGFVARTYEAAEVRSDGRVSVGFERAGTAGNTTIALVPVAFPWRMLPLTWTAVITGALVLARRPGTRVARMFFLVGVVYGLHWTFFFGGPRLQTQAWAVVFFCASTVMLPFILRLVLIFPQEVGPLPWWPWLFAVFGPISLSWVFGVPLPPETGFRAVFTINVVFITTLLVIATRRFRRATPFARRQLKWVVLGMYLGTMPVLVADVVAAVAPALWWLHEAAAIAEIIIPVSVLIAILHANFFDVDRLITGTAVYSFLSVLLLAALLIGVPRVARATSTAADLDPQTVQLVLSIVVAAGLVPGRRLLRPPMERWLFRERHALRTGVEHLLQDLAVADGPEELLTLAGERLHTLVRPRACVIYAPLGKRFDPVFARGTEPPGGPLPLPTDAAALVALRTRTAPLDLTQWASARRQKPLSPDERAELEGLRAAVFLPVRRGAELAAAICLGEKRSGDVYTPDDLALLGAVAEKLSSELLRFDTAVILRQEREMGEALRRYVPDPVVARLERGQSIEGGERDVSVLFVDISGFTAYSEQQAVGTVFSVVNRYTEAVSAVIQRRGGTVVEFLGDGLMAVFGAPEPIPDHARGAVQAACEVVATVRELGLGTGDGEAPIAVGVGIASGQAFVGNIHTSDRLVYTAVGDVVNLASRIQGLTRELRAAVAIDARTHDAAGGSVERFERHTQMRIRGRAEPVDVYSLPLSAA